MPAAALREACGLDSKERPDPGARVPYVVRVRMSTGIQKVYTKVNLREQKSDFAYWQTQPYQVRLATLEQIRREFHQWR